MSTNPRILDRELRLAVDHLVEDLLEDRRAELAHLGPEAAGLIDTLGTYLDGGKRLRPRICYWTGTAVNGRPPTGDLDRVLVAFGGAIELTQAAALLHDDVIDRSDTRRGRPAAHVQAADDHRSQGLAGDPAAFGQAVAIILGDLALSWSVDLAEQYAELSSTGTEALEELRALRTEVMGGQFLDVLNQAGGFSSPGSPFRAALEVIRWKTVSYTVHRPARIGAFLAGATAEQFDGLERWAYSVGTAFQLRDDLLGVLGDPERTGKPIGDDLREGKRTVLVARAHEELADTVLLDRVLGNRDASAEDVLALTAHLRAGGVVASVAADVEDLRTRASDALADTPSLGEEGRAGLEAITAQATDLGGLEV
jgi:geranylgeranyl diphosphate synthase type I